MGYSEEFSPTTTRNVPKKGGDCRRGDLWPVIDHDRILWKKEARNLLSWVQSEGVNGIENGKNGKKRYEGTRATDYCLFYSMPALNTTAS